jgi:hypothetical protein
LCMPHFSVLVTEAGGTPPFSYATQERLRGGCVVALEIVHRLREDVAGLGRYDCVCSCERVDGLGDRTCMWSFNVDRCRKSRRLM